MNNNIGTLADQVSEAARRVSTALTPSVRLQRMMRLREACDALFAAGVTANIDQVADEMEAER